MTSKHLNSVEDVKHLLSLYYSGETTPDQEAALTHYFLSHSEVEPSLRDDRRIFIALAHSRDQLVPADLHERIIRATCGRKNNYLRILTRIAAAAACIAAVATATVLYLRSTEPVVELESESLMAQLADSTAADTVALVETVVAESPLTANASPNEMSSGTRHKATTRHKAIATREPVDTQLLLYNSHRALDHALERSFSAANERLKASENTFKAMENSIANYNK